MPTLLGLGLLGFGGQVRRRCGVWFAMLLWMAAATAGAQYGAHDSGYRISYLNYLRSATGMAVDASGNVYFVSGGNVYKTPYNDYYSTTALPLPAGETAGSYVAVDASGNVFFDASNGSQTYLVKATYASATDSYSSANLVSPVSGLNSPSGVAVDGAGDVFLSALASGPRAVFLKFPANASTGSEVLYNPPYGSALAVDTVGNAFFLLPNTGNGEVQESVLQSGTYQTATTVLSGICPSTCTLAGIAVDSSDTLYITNNTDSVVLQYPLQAAGGYAATAVARIEDALSSTTGLALASNGMIYTEDSYGSGYVDTVFPPAASSLGTAALGSSGSTAALTFRFDAAATLGSIAVTTRGASSLDFRNAGTGTCVAGQSYAQDASCTVGVGFSASNYAGSRSGAVSLLDNTGAVLGTGYVYGTATGSQFAYMNLFSNLVATASYPLGVAVDGNRAVYFLDGGNGRVLRETPTGGGYTQTVAISGLTNARYVAVDGAGSVYTFSTDPLDASEQAVFKVTPNGSGGYGPQELVVRGLSSPRGLAVDNAGDAFITDTASGNRLIKATFLGGSYMQTVLLTSLAATNAIAVDGSGNVYLAFSNGQIALSTNNSGSYGAPAVIASGLGTPQGLALDGAGDLYVTDSAGLRVVRLAAGTWAQTTIGSSGAISLGAPFGMAVDDAGDVYASGSGGQVAMAPASAQARSFAVTPVGSTSSDSPQTVTVANIGTGALTFASNPSLGQPDPSISTNFTVGSGSTCPQLAAGGTAMLATGATCDYLVSFAPISAAGNLSGTLTISYETQNPGYTTSTVGLSGTATFAVAPTPTFSPAAGAYATARPVTISDTALTPYGAIYYTTDGTTPTTASAQYTAPVTVAVSETLKAIYAGSGYTQSAVASAAYTIGSPPVCSLAVHGTSTAGVVTAVATCTDPQGSAISTYSFAWGDGSLPTTNASSSATHTYAAAGTYTVTLTATDALNDSSTTTATVTPNQPPVCSVSASGTSTAGAVTATAACTDPQGSAISSYRFTWGDGSTPTSGPASTATHTYASPGSYVVTLTATDALGLASAATTASVTPNQPPACSVTARATTTAGNVAAAATCTDPQGSAISSYSFNWGDGSSPTSSTSGSVTHTYAGAGAFTVNLTATDALGLSGTATTTVRPNQAPVCTLVVGGTSIAGAVTAQATCTDPQGSAISSYSFNWGDGSPPTTVTSSGATHTYAAASTYTVTLTATDALGVAGSTSQRVTPNQLPVCSVTVHGTSTAGAVTAAASCTDPQGSAISSYSFSWGDNQSTPGTNSNAVHTYTAPATYTVTLVATDALGLAGSATAMVTPNQLPVCTLSVIQGQSAQSVKGIPTTFVTATPTCTDPQNQLLPLVIQWGDGTQDVATSGVAATHGYVTPAVAMTVPVVVTETDGAGLSGSATQAVALLALVTPPAGMSANASGQAQQQPSGIAPTQVTFLCTGLQVGTSTVAVLPSQYGITCTAPTFTATSTSASNVTVSVQTTAATANAAWLKSYGSHGSEILAASLSLPGVLLLGLGVTLPGSRRRLRHQLRTGGALLLLCCTVCSCGGSFTPPPVIATPKGLYLLTITEAVTGGATPTSFVQTSLIVPLEVQ